MNPPGELIERVEALLGRQVEAWERATQGYSIAERWTLQLANGSKVFAKMAPTDDIAWRIRDEHRNMSSFTADFRCGVLAWQDGARPLFVLEDLSHAHWPPDWRPGDVDNVLGTLEQMWSMPADHLPPSSGVQRMFSGWREVQRDPTGFLGLGMVSRDWLEASLPTLIDAADGAVFEGDDFLHMDVRSDNMCFDGSRVVFVDWNWAVRGHRDLDLSCWLPSLRLEGGPLPEEIAPGLGAHASGISAYFAANAPLPVPAGAPTVRKFQLRQLRISLPWACRELGLPLPDVPYARNEIERIDRARDAGRIDESDWHAQTEEVLIDAYLASDDPRAQSGKGGDEETWRWARELVLDVFPACTTFLDVGCANGYLMESLERWGRERGIDVDPHGLDISWRIAALARQRLPRWADRIFVGNAIDWTPDRRFDVVQTGLDEVPPNRRRELVRHILDRYLVDGGKLVFRAERVTAGELDVVAKLREIGLVPDGVLEATDPRTGDVRRTAWLCAPLP